MCSASVNTWMKKTLSFSTRLHKIFSCVIVGYHTCTVSDLRVCVSSSFVCFGIFVVMTRLVVWLVVWLAVLGGNLGSVQFGGTVEIVIGQKNRSYSRSHRRRNHLYDRIRNHHTQCRYVLWFHPKQRLMVGGCGCN